MWDTCVHACTCATLGNMCLWCVFTLGKPHCVVVGWGAEVIEYGWWQVSKNSGRLLLTCVKTALVFILDSSVWLAARLCSRLILLLSD